tara:strand:- start:54 stop:1022 length:969 start_codon:yes stop_codon:yes gene_type:complete
MARRYVRDKIGRFASSGGGGGSFGGGGKVGKSAKNVKARAAYKKQAVNLREAKKMAGGKMTTSREQKYWNRQLGGAKSGMTRVTNRLTNKRAAKSGLKETFSSQKVAGRKATFKSKTTKGRASKSEWKAAKGADRKSSSTTDSAQKRVIKKQTGKKAYSQGFRETPARTKAPRAGSKTKSQKLKAKIDNKKFANKALRGSEFKGVKKRTTTKKVTAKKPSYKKPKTGETAKQYKARLKRSGTNSTKRALSGNFGTRSEYYSVPGSKTGGKQTRKSVNRAKNRDFYSEGSNKRSKAITKSKQRNKAKVKKQTNWEKKIKGRKG